MDATSLILVSIPTILSNVSGGGTRGWPEASAAEELQVLDGVRMLDPQHERGAPGSRDNVTNKKKLKGNLGTI